MGLQRVAYAAAGEGRPLVLLHGALADSRLWRRQLADLGADFRVLAWDAPGCGGSSDPPATWRMPEYADCLAAWLAAVGAERPHILGLSWGSTLALELYRRHPHVPASLVLAGAYAGWAGSLPPEVVAERLGKFLGEVDRPPEEWAESYVPGFVTEAAPAEVADELVALIAEHHPAGSRTMAYAMAEADLRDVLQRIQVPTLLLYGALDRRSPLSVAKELRAAIPGSQLVVLPGAAHACNVEAPDEFDAAVRDFLGPL